MTVGGWYFMAIANGLVVGLFVWCIWRSTAPDPETKDSKEQADAK